MDQRVLLAYMIHFHKAELRRIAKITSVVIACISLAFGSNVNVLLTPHLVEEAHVADSGFFPQWASSPGEVPHESSGQEEQTEEMEGPSFSLRRKTHRAARTHVDVALVDEMDVGKSRPTPVVFPLNRTLVRQFEHCFRNGCGAHLRC